MLREKQDKQDKARKKSEPRKKVPLRRIDPSLRHHVQKLEKPGKESETRHK